METFKWLDENNISFIAHRGKIPYIDREGNNRNYYPDAFLIEENKYIDIKNDYHLDLQKEKFELIFEQNKHLKIEIWTKNILLKKGIKIN